MKIVVGKKRIDADALTIIICIVLLYISYFSWFPFAQYVDDIVALIFLFPVLEALLLNNWKSGRCRQIARLLLVLTFVGVLSNILSDVSRTIYDIVIDIFSVWKIFSVYLGTSILVSRKEQNCGDILSFLGSLSKLFITSSFVFAVLNFFGIIDMYTMIRFGMRTFEFYFGNASQFGVFMGAALAFLIFSGKDNAAFVGMALVSLLLTAKGMSFIIAATYIILEMISKRKKIKLWQIIAVGAALMVILNYQISTYLLNESSIRAVLIKYGFVTALNYFPLGAGFGTYGSNIAVDHYSPLYVQYGFLAREGLAGYMSNGTTYLNDVYIGMIAGEFGFLGLIIWLFIIYTIGMELIKHKSNDHKCQHIALGCFACLCGMFVMAGSVKVAPGEILMVVFALFSDIERGQRIKYSARGN